jgi:hypothetical protein
MTGARAIIAIEKNRLTFSTVVCLLSPAADMAPHQVCAAVGQEETHAPQQTASCFDHQIGGKPRRSPFPCILGRDRLPMKRQEG